MKSKIIWCTGSWKIVLSLNYFTCFSKIILFFIRYRDSFQFNSSYIVNLSCTLPLLDTPTFLMFASLNFIIRAAVKFVMLNLLADSLSLSFQHLAAIMCHCHYNHTPTKFMTY